MDKEIKNHGLDFYRIKTEWTSEVENGALGKVKTEELVAATSYSEAEKVAYAIAESDQRFSFGSVNIEIIKTKIENILYNTILATEKDSICDLVSSYFEEPEDSGIGLYQVKVINFTIDEKTAKQKKETITVYTPALSNEDAAKRIDAYMKNTLNECIIRDTKFDRAEAIYWPKELYKSKVEEFNLSQN